MLESIVGDFLILFVTIDPVGTLSLFVGLTAGVPASERPRVAFKSVFYGGIVLMGFLVAGQLVLTGLGVRLVSFQLAGGIILFLLGLQMVFGTGSAVQPPEPEADHDVAVFPLAIPSIAGPGAILAVVILTDNNRFSLAEQAITGVVLVVVLAITLAALLLAHRIHRVIGNTGAAIIIRVMGLLLAALAAEHIVAGLSEMLAASGAG